MAGNKEKELTTIIVQVSKETKKKFKFYCLERDVKMSDLLRDFINSRLKEKSE